MIGRIWLVTAGVLVMIVLVWVAALWVPTNQRLDDALQRRDIAQAALNDLEAERQRLVVANRDVPVLQTQLRDLMAAIPERPGLADFMIEVATAESESGVDVTTVETSDPVVGDDGLVAIGLDLQVRASYFQLLDFMNRLSRLERVYVVDALEIDALGDETSTAPPELDVILQGRMFVADDEDIDLPEPVVLSSGTPTATTSADSDPDGEGG